MAKNLDDLTNSWTPDPNRLSREDVQSALKTAQAVLGYSGRMLSGSKSGYSKNNPANVPVFNGNVITEKLGKIWYGDLDITLDGEKLQALAITLGETVYVLREMDARFENENNPKLERAVVKFTATGVEFGESLKAYDKENEFMVETCNRGKFAGKIVYKKEYRR